MRAFDGSLFHVDWYIIDDPNAETIDFPTPFGSYRDGESVNVWDDGGPGEIPELSTGRSTKIDPGYKCNCYVGIPEWWKNGWPLDAPPVILGPDGFPIECCDPDLATGAYDCGYDFGYDTGGMCPDVPGAAYDTGYDLGYDS